MSQKSNNSKINTTYNRWELKSNDQEELGDLRRFQDQEQENREVVQINYKKIKPVRRKEKKLYIKGVDKEFIQKLNKNTDKPALRRKCTQKGLALADDTCYTVTQYPCLDVGAYWHISAEKYSNIQSEVKFSEQTIDPFNCRQLVKANEKVGKARLLKDIDQEFNKLVQCNDKKCKELGIDAQKVQREDVLGFQNSASRQKNLTKNYLWTTLYALNENHTVFTYHKKKEEEKQQFDKDYKIVESQFGKKKPDIKTEALEMLSGAIKRKQIRAFYIHPEEKERIYKIKQEKATQRQVKAYLKQKKTFEKTTAKIYIKERNKHFDKYVNKMKDSNTRSIFDEPLVIPAFKFNIDRHAKKELKKEIAEQEKQGKESPKEVSMVFKEKSYNKENKEDHSSSDEQFDEHQKTLLQTYTIISLHQFQRLHQNQKKQTQWVHQNYQGQKEQYAEGQSPVDILFEMLKSGESPTDKVVKDIWDNDKAPYVRLVAKRYISLKRYNELSQEYDFAKMTKDDIRRFKNRFQSRIHESQEDVQ